jgi:DNA ligase (NAD+)
MKIEVPTICPSCLQKLTRINEQVFCENSGCPGREAQKIEHFAKALKIKGLGPSTINKLNINSISNIYDLSLEDMVERIGSERIATKVFNEIQKSKNCSLQELLPAFSIPLIGKTASEKLCGILENLDDLTEDVCKEAGLGPKATSSLISWFEVDYSTIYKGLPFSFKSKKTTRPNITKGVVCITGKLSSFKTKSQAEKLLVDSGYSVKSALTKDVTILVNESGIESAKTKKARDNGVSIVTNINQLIEV